MTLFVNACVRKGSRTKRLADRLLAGSDGPVREVRRDRLIAEGLFGDPLFALARQFAEAEEIVIAAPFWDLSFPAALKQYLEQINVIGITFCYTPEGRPKGLCRARRLSYVTTAGGEFFPEEYGFGYVRALAQTFYGIPDVRLVKAVGLDLDGADPEAILRAAESGVR